MKALLAAHGLDNQTSCADGLTHTDWVPDLWSPVVHEAREVSPSGRRPPPAHALAVFYFVHMRWEPAASAGVGPG